MSRSAIEGSSTSAASGMKSYTRADMEVFNLLHQPLWVFDIEKKSMWWANRAALDLWNAESLESLLARDFADMSEATVQRLGEYMLKFQRGEFVNETWTYFPKNRGPTTVDVTMSGILVENGRMVMLNEGKEIPKENLDLSALRGVEMLRHLPVSVSQFDHDGVLMHQNPEFGANYFDLDATKNQKQSFRFQDMFVDEEVGSEILKQVVENGKDYCGEVQQCTVNGLTWSAIKVRKSRDPVTEDPVVLYSARDITDVIKAKKEADDANLQKSEFLAVMAHEIRTPLHQVVGFIELLAETALESEQERFVKLLQGSSLSLMAVINDLLDYTKLEAGKMSLESIQFNPRSLIDGTLETVQERATKNETLLVKEFSSYIPSAMIGDPNRLRQILLNFLSNAVKFTKKGRVTLTASQIGKETGDGKAIFRFMVEDNGIGISPENQHLIFQKYKQADLSIARNFGGTGLGLPICEQLAILMGGSIHFESEPGKGSKFWVDIPFETFQADEGPTSTPEESSSSSNQNPSAADDLESSSSLRILVAEDNKINQKLVNAMLKRMGHEVTIVDNGQQALEEVDRSEFDAILMDVQMPVLDGIQSTKEIRNRGLATPIIGLTASFQRSDIDFYRDIGMDDCISKPVRMQLLKETLRISSTNNPAIS